jgi:lipopolysaccharide export system protein LptC
MATGPGLYSRIVAILKVGLPLLALAMLGSLFLFTDQEAPQGELAFSPADLAELAAGMEVLNPVLSGTTDANDAFRFSAAVVVPDAAPPTRAQAREITGRMSFVGGPEVDLAAEAADLDLETRTLALEGNVRVTTSTDYRLEAVRMQADLRGGILRAEDAVTAAGPMGTITARRLEVRPDPDNGGSRLFLFEGAVRLVYDPRVQPE